MARLSPAALKERAERVPVLGTALAVNQRSGEIGGGLLASAVTLSLFLSLFPILLVAVAVLGFVSAGNDDFGADIVADLGLTGPAADFIIDGLEAATKGRAATSVVGFATLAWAALGVVGAFQAVGNRAWQVPGRGAKDRLFAAVWLFGSLLLIGGAITLAGLLPAVPGWAAPLQVLAGVALEVAFFLWTFRILLAHPLPLRAHLPGAVLGGIGFHALTIAATVLVPGRVAASSGLYGTLGVAIALLGWLLFFGRLLVYAVVLNVVRYERQHGTVRIEVEAPRFEGQVPLAGDRGGVRKPAG